MLFTCLGNLRDLIIGKRVIPKQQARNINMGELVFIAGELVQTCAKLYMRRINLHLKPLSSNIHSRTAQLIGWLVGCLLACLLACLLGLLVGCLVGWFAGWFVGWLVGWLVDKPRTNLWLQW